MQRQIKCNCCGKPIRAKYAETLLKRLVPPVHTACLPVCMRHRGEQAHSPRGTRPRGWGRA